MCNILFAAARGTTQWAHGIPLATAGGITWQLHGILLAVVGGILWQTCYIYVLMAGKSANCRVTFYSLRQRALCLRCLNVVVISHSYCLRMQGMLWQKLPLTKPLDSKNLHTKNGPWIVIVVHYEGSWGVLVFNLSIIIDNWDFWVMWWCPWV